MGETKAYGLCKQQMMWEGGEFKKGTLLHQTWGKTNQWFEVTVNLVWHILPFFEESRTCTFELIGDMCQAVQLGDLKSPIPV